VLGRADEALRLAALDDARDHADRVGVGSGEGGELLHPDVLDEEVRDQEADPLDAYRPVDRALDQVQTPAERAPVAPLAGGEVVGIDVVAEHLLGGVGVDQVQPVPARDPQHPPFEARTPSADRR
jgi:hypothetical protein